MRRIATILVCCTAVALRGDDAEKQADPPETVLLLHFDEGHGTVTQDASGNGLQGVIRGATWTDDGRFGKALRFDGDGDSVEVARHDVLDFGKKTDFTVECWLRFAPETPRGFYFLISSRLRQDMPGYTLFIHRNRRLCASVGDKINAIDSLQTRESVADGQWHHVALTCDRDGSASLYLDGDLQGATGMDHLVTVTNEERPLRIGDRGYSGDFVGLIDEVRISRGVRTDFRLHRPY